MASRTSKVLALSAGKATARLIGLVTMMVMARVLIEEDLAAYRQTILAFAIVGPILELGIGHGLYYFLPGETERIRGRVTDALALLGVMGLLYALFIGFGGNHLLARRFSNPQVAGLLLWMVPFAIVTVPANLMGTVLVARGKVMLVTVVELAKQLVVGFATLIPLLLWHQAKAPLIGNVTASVLLGLASIGLVIAYTPKGSMRLSVSGMGELLRFSVPLALATMLGTISLQLDKMIVGFVCTPAQFAAYALGALELPVIGMVTASITAVMLVDMRKAVSSGNQPEALRLFQLTAEKSAYILLPLMFFFLVCGDSFIRVLFTDRYTDSILPFRLYLLLLPIRTVVFGSLLIAMGLNRFVLYRALAELVLNVALSIWFVHVMGPWGATLATVCTTYACSVTLNLYMISRAMRVPWRSILPMNHFLKITLQCLPAVLVLLVVTELPILSEHYLRLGMGGFIFFAFLAWWWDGKIYSWRRVLARVTGRGS